VKKSLNLFLAVQTLPGGHKSFWGETNAPREPFKEPIGKIIKNEHLLKFVFCIIWHLGGSRRLQNAPMGCGNNLLSLLEIFKNRRTNKYIIFIYMDIWMYGHRIQQDDIWLRSGCFQELGNLCIYICFQDVGNMCIYIYIYIWQCLISFATGRVKRMDLVGPNALPDRPEYFLVHLSSVMSSVLHDAVTTFS